MTKASCSSVLIIDTPGTLLGIVTERDLMTRVVAQGLNPEKTLARDVMTHNPHCVGPDMLVADAVVMMIERGFRHLPILSATERSSVSSQSAMRCRSSSRRRELAEFHDQVNDALG